MAAVPDAAKSGGDCLDSLQYTCTRGQKKAGRIGYDLDLEQLPPSNRIFYRVTIRVKDTLYTTLAFLQVVDLK